MVLFYYTRGNRVRKGSEERKHWTLVLEKYKIMAWNTEGKHSVSITLDTTWYL